MLTLLLVSLYEFKLFLQIVLWIAIPGTILAIVITTILHYRRKKRLALEPEPEFAGPASMLMSSGETGQLPDWLASGNPDNTNLLKKYEREIRRYREDYNNLEQDFRALEEKYGDLLNKAYHNDQSGNEAIDRLHQEIKGYKLKIAQLQQAIEYNQQNSEGGNTTAQDPMELHNLRISIAQLQEENGQLKEKLDDQQFMQDLLEEKKLQTDFLQQQLELRIKNYHQLEKQAGGASTELAQLRQVAEEYNGKEQALQQDLQQKQEAIREKTDHIQKLESGLEALQQQQASLQSVIDEKQNAIRELESNIVREQEKTKELENKLELSSQLFVRIYAELAKCFDAGLVNGQNGHAASLINAGNGQPVNATNAFIGQPPVVN
jgi:peptidoglycan hydrolase CwlO-like protein